MTKADLMHMHMPPFARIQWADPAYEAVWGPRINRISQVFHRLEVLSVAAGLRRVATAHFRPEDLPRGVMELARMGLSYLPLRQVGAYTGFAHYHPPVEPGKPWTYYGVVGRPEDLAAFAEATDRGDHSALGELLGYPACCRTFFSEVWTAGFVDPVWHAAQNALLEGAEVVEEGPRLLHLKGHYPEVLPVLRYIGVRLVPHIPHSLRCEASRRMAQDWMALAREEGLGEEVDWAYEMLGWAMEWSVLHGIAEVRTPYFKIATNSIASKEKWTVRLEGNVPEDAPRGLSYPYRVPRKTLTNHPAFVEVENWAR